MLVHRSTRNQAELLFQVRLLWRTACWHPHHLARGEITVFTYNSLRGPVCYSIRSPSSPIRHLQPLTCGPETAKTDSLHEYWTSHISVTVPEQHIYTHTFHGLFWKKTKKTNKQTNKKTWVFSPMLTISWTVLTTENIWETVWDTRHEKQQSVDWIGLSSISILLLLRFLALASLLSLHSISKLRPLHLLSGCFYYSLWFALFTSATSISH